MDTVASFGCGIKDFKLYQEKEIKRDRLDKLLNWMIVKLFETHPFCLDENGDLKLDQQFEWQFPLTIKIVKETSGPYGKYEAIVTAEGEWHDRPKNEGGDV